MYIIIAIFYVSIIVLIAMLLTKRREIKTGKSTFLSRFGNSTGSLSYKIFTATRNGISYLNRHTVIAVAQWLAIHVLFHVRKVYVDLKHKALSNPHSKKVIDAVRGRGEVRDHGASFYLRRISGRDENGQ